MFLDEDLSSPRSSFAYASIVWTMNMNLVMPTFGIYMPGTVLYSTYSTESTLVGSHARGVKLWPRVSPHLSRKLSVKLFRQADGPSNSPQALRRYERSPDWWCLVEQKADKSAKIEGHSQNLNLTGDGERQ